MFRAVCLASGAQVILKRYTKAKMDSKAETKMQREVRPGLVPSAALARSSRFGAGVLA